MCAFVERLKDIYRKIAAIKLPEKAFPALSRGLVAVHAYKWFRIATVMTLAVISFILIPVSVHLLSGFFRSFALITGYFAETVRGSSLMPEAGPIQSDPVTFLIYGIDAGEWVQGTYRPGPGRADTIVLIKAFPASNTASLLSIPRDTLVEIPGYPGDDKINHAYAFGQAALLVQTVERFTGIPVDYYAGLNYTAFRDIVDYLGGVEFEVDRVIVSRGLRLEKGLQLLDGDAAFALVSTRQDPLGDIDRVKRQQRFIKAVWLESTKRPIDDIIYLVLAAWNNADTNMSLLDAIGLSGSLKGIKEEDVVMEIVPGWFYNRGGISYWGPYRARTDQLIRDLFYTPAQCGAGCSADH